MITDSLELSINRRPTGASEVESVGWEAGVEIKAKAMGEMGGTQSRER
jgi:hypothetical protein